LLELGTGLLALQAVAVLLGMSLMPAPAMSTVVGVPVVSLTLLRDMGEGDAMHRYDETVKGLREIGTDLLREHPPIALLSIEGRE
jgi:hypothetical protein